MGKTEGDKEEEKAGDSNEGEAAEEDAAKEKKKDYPGDVTLDHLKKEVESISHRIETETKNLAEKEEVQKVLTPLMAKLAVAKKKFVSMTQKKKNKKNKDGDEDERDEQGVEVELGKEEDAKTVSERQKAEEDEKKQDATKTTPDEKTRS